MIDKITPSRLSPTILTDLGINNASDNEYSPLQTKIFAPSGISKSVFMPKTVSKLVGVS